MAHSQGISPQLAPSAWGAPITSLQDGTNQNWEVLTEDQVVQLLSPAEALAAIEESFVWLAEGTVADFVRWRGTFEGATLSMMGAVAPPLGVAGVQSYPIVNQAVTQGSAFMLVLYGLPSGQCVAVIESGTLSQLRTGAASAVAARCLAREDSETLTVFGAGWQAEGQVLALLDVLPKLRRVLVVGRSEERRDAFVGHLRERLAVEVDAPGAEEATRAGDVIVTATGSAEPVFDGEWLQPGTHITAMGSNFATKREIDAVTLERSACVAVDSVPVAQEIGGDFLLNGFPPERAVPLGDVLTGRAPGRRRASDITVFKSHGLALQDVVCGARVLRALREQRESVAE